MSNLSDRARQIGRDVEGQPILHAARAKQALFSLAAEIERLQRIEEAAQRFVDAYQGNKGQTLGNGAARRSESP